MLKFVSMDSENTAHYTANDQTF